MEDVLYLNDLHDPIDGDGKKPSNVDEEKWKKMDKKAIALIRQYLDDSVFIMWLVVNPRRLCGIS